jgi:hypothetical protein
MGDCDDRPVHIFGSIAAGWLCGHRPNRHVLASIYALRGVSIAVFLLTPLSPTSALPFAAATGLLWASAVTPVASLVTLMFGTRHLAALFGLAHFFHQVGAFWAFGSAASCTSGPALIEDSGGPWLLRR